MKRRHSHADEFRAPRREPNDVLPLFAAPSVAVDTSERAADSIRHTLRDAHRVILALLVVHTRLTCEEIRQRTGWTGDYARPRLYELEGMGWVQKCDGKQGRDLVTRPTMTGRQAMCYELTALGQQKTWEPQT